MQRHEYRGYRSEGQQQLPAARHSRALIRVPRPRLHWKYQYIDDFGQVFIPFASMRGDVAAQEINNDPGVANFINPGDSSEARAMPTVGLEYRYPFVGIESWGTQTIEPIGQIIARPNETEIGKLPNEDSQSLIFDDDRPVQSRQVRRLGPG